MYHDVEHLSCLTQPTGPPRHFTEKLRRCWNPLAWGCQSLVTIPLRRASDLDTPCICRKHPQTQFMTLRSFKSLLVLCCAHAAAWKYIALLSTVGRGANVFIYGAMSKTWSPNLKERWTVCTVHHSPLASISHHHEILNPARVSCVSIPG